MPCNTLVWIRQNCGSRVACSCNSYNFQRRLIENEQIERQRQDDIDKLLLFAKDRTEKEKV